MGVRRTAEQEAAVTNRGGGILVSAAAGSGKTRVLVERLLERVVKEERRIDAFLIITYTKAAAEELRARISRELSERLAEDPTNAHLRRQTALLYQTQISTIHALCSVLLREWGHLLDLPADFRLCEEGEAQTLMLRTLEDVLEDRYEEIRPEDDFAQLLDVLSAGRDDSRLLEITLDVYSRIQSHRNPDRWMREQEERMALTGVTDAGETVWGKLLLEHTRLTAGYWRERIRQAVRLAQGDEKLKKAYVPSLQETLLGLERLETATSECWDAVGTVEVPFPKLAAARGVEDAEAQRKIKSIREKCKKRIDAVRQQFQDSSEDLLTDMRVVYPAMRGLFALVRDFSAAYSAAKRRKGLLDFSDLEHLAVRLLVGEDGTPTPVADQLGARFTEIMVDEYQDTNEVQNVIFDALSDHGRNLFLVGDVKQSIYRFRLADPTIFLQKYNTFLPYVQAGEGEDRKVTLSMNFRSRPEVLAAANFLFYQIMSDTLGEMNYTPKEALYPGGTFPEGGDCYRTELDVLDLREKGRTPEEKESGNLLEARFAAGRIARLLKESFPVSDGQGGTRPVRPEDIVILLRSPGTVRHHYIAALNDRGIPWSTEEGGKFFETTEIAVALSLLQVVDNPRQDVPLLAVLRSPVWNFSGDRLAEIRSYGDGDFYSALCTAAQAGLEDCRAFLEELDRLRFGAGEKSSHQLIWHLYQRTNLLAVFGVMPNGEERQSNLLAFYELARRFEASGHRGLFGFLTHLERVRETGANLTIPREGKKTFGVRILSIHRSKGLEFPVVLLCGLGRRFNRTDLQKPVLFHPKLGLGPKGVDGDRGVEFTTLAREAVRLQLDREMMAEEMRLLYVAMTRAKEKLILTHALTYGGSDLESLSVDAACPVEPQAMAACSSVGQWILLVALTRPEGECLRQAAGVQVDLPDTEFGPAWDIRMWTGLPSETDKFTAGDAAEPEWNIPDRESILDRLNWRYPYAALSRIPAKLTATQIREAEEEIPAERLPGLPAEQKEFSRPRFAEEEFGLTAAQRGTALHTVLQCIDRKRTGTDEQLREELKRLAEQAFLTPLQAESVNLAALRRFFQSPLGREFCSVPALSREYPFSILVPAEQYYEGLPEGEELLLQGIVDCWFETEGGITVLDFKTDRVTAEQAKERAEQYRPQLDAYGRALSEVIGKPVDRRVLWFFSCSRPVELGPYRPEGKKI